MKVLSSTQVRAWDDYTIHHEPISSLDLMERAATRCVGWIEKHCHSQRFVVFCGTGNNGGDGLAIARQLALAGKNVSVYVAGADLQGSPDFNTNFERLASIGVVAELLTAESIPSIRVNEADVVLDCLVGTGITGPIGGIKEILIRYLNACACDVISIDLPSGMLPDLLEPQPGEVIRAKFTLSFQQPKLAFFFRENALYTGEWTVLDIGLSPEFALSQETMFHFTDRSWIQTRLKKRTVFSHKNEFGHLLVYAGSKGMMGAAVLCARAGFRSGCGLVTAHIPSGGLEIFQATLPEAMCVASESSDYISGDGVDNRKSAVCIGPGIGVHEATANFLSGFLEQCRIPLVMDADALNIIAEKKWLNKLPPGSVITPHPGEFDRLFGKAGNSMDRFNTAISRAQQLHITIVLKGAYTAIALADGSVYFNSTGNSAMSTAGSGDVLTGVIGGLMAQGYSPSEAATMGVYLHGLAGDIALKEIGHQGLLAGDIADRLPRAMDQSK